MSLRIVCLSVVSSLFDRCPSRPAGPMGKRKRRKLSGSEDADSQQPQLSISAPAGHGWTPKHLGDLKAYNKKAVEKPGEVSRTADRAWRGAGTGRRAGETAGRARWRVGRDRRGGERLLHHTVGIERSRREERTTHDRR